MFELGDEENTALLQQQQQQQQQSQHQQHQHQRPNNNKEHQSSTTATSYDATLTDKNGPPAAIKYAISNEYEYESSASVPVPVEDSSEIVRKEAIAMVSLAFPIIATNVFEMLPGIVSIMLVGHVRVPQSSEYNDDNNDNSDESYSTKEYLGAAALAVMFINLTALSVGFGLASAMDTLASQAFGVGPQQLARKGKIYLSTGIMVLSAALIGIVMINVNAALILKSLGQPPYVSDLAGTFVLYLLPGIPCLFLYELLRKLLQAQNVAMPMFYVAMIGNLINAGLGYYLVFVLEDRNSTWMGRLSGPNEWLGAAVARTAGNISMPLLLILYLYASDQWKSFLTTTTTTATTTEHCNVTRNLVISAWQGIPKFIGLGVPGALQLCFEWWAFECMALLSGLLPNAIVAIGTNAVLLNISSMVYMLYLGVSMAVTVRMGNALGANQPHRAKVASYLAFGVSSLCAGCCATLLIVFRTSLPSLFTHDPEIRASCSQLLYVAAAFQWPDAMNATIQGIFRGSGRQRMGAWLNFVSYYVVGLPIGAFLAFGMGQGLMGLWVGITLGLVVICVMGVFVVSQSNWKQLSFAAVRRTSLPQGTSAGEIE